MNGCHYRARSPNESKSDRNSKAAGNASFCNEFLYQRNIIGFLKNADIQSP